MESKATHPSTVVYIEDDAKLARLTAKYLETHGIDVSIASTPSEGMAAVAREQPDVILLDLMLPEMDGFEVCRRLRERTAIPIIMVTARVEEVDRVLGLEGGADDYVAKPFSSRELLARIRAHARRAQGAVGPKDEILVAGPLAIDANRRSATLNDLSLDLTTYEFDLLKTMAERPGRVFTREQLVALVRGSAEESFDRAVDVHICHLRRKLGDDPRQPCLLKTVRGVGYVLAINES